MRLVFLGSDVLLYFSILILAIFLFNSLKKPLNRKAIKRLLKFKIVIVTLTILGFYLTVAVLDSIHFQRKLKSITDISNVSYSAKIESLLDVLFAKRSIAEEKTYSSPFALRSFLKEAAPSGGQYYPKLTGINNIKTVQQRNNIIFFQILKSIFISSLFTMLCLLIFKLLFKKNFKVGCLIRSYKFELLFYSSFTFIIVVCYLLESQLHILGTDKVGQDVFYQTIKSIRTGLVIGLLTTLVTLPFAIVLGLSAGYFGGRLDSLIQYIYITISSIPGVLLIAASILSMQVFISNHADLFTTLMARSDARLVALCLILGLTGWTSLCRVLRAETLKLREADYIQAAKVLGSSTRVIIFKHILPNVMHLIIIAIVLDFSFLVLAEAVLSYIGVGVSPLTISWGNMINGARLELAREPLVWWPMLAAFVFMFIFVISINLLADQVRDAFSPRTD